MFKISGTLYFLQPHSIKSRQKSIAGVASWNCFHWKSPGFYAHDRLGWNFARMHWESETWITFTMSWNGVVSLYEGLCRLIVVPLNLVVVISGLMLAMDWANVEATAGRKPPSLLQLILLPGTTPSNRHHATAFSKPRSSLWNLAVLQLYFPHLFPIFMLQIQAYAYSNWKLSSV